MIEPAHLLNEVIRPVLRYLGQVDGIACWSVPAERIVLGTACKESQCGRWLTQLAAGPAIGIYQMEPGMTGYADIWANYLNFRPEFAQKVNYWRVRWGNGTGAQEMAGNLYFATAMCRIKYLRDKKPIPATLPEQAAYWKRVYNTPQGLGTEGEYIAAWQRYVSPGDLVA